MSAESVIVLQRPPAVESLHNLCFQARHYACGSARFFRLRNGRQNHVPGGSPPVRASILKFRYQLSA